VGVKLVERGSNKYIVDTSNVVMYNVYMNLYIGILLLLLLQKELQSYKRPNSQTVLRTVVNFKIVLIAHCSVLKNLEDQSV
jgi:hypothetical protein